MIEPALQDEAFLRDVAQAAAEDHPLCLWWLGQSGYLVQYAATARDRRHLLIDPYLSDSLTRKYAATDKPHVRMTERVIDPARLAFVDLITSSHIHTDHLDGETIGPILTANPRVEILVPQANRAFAAERLAVEADRLIGIDDGQTRGFDGLAVTAVPAAHEQLSRDAGGHHHFLGYVFRFGGRTIYHSGDTMLYDGMVERLRAFEIDLAILPINGRFPQRRVAGNLNGVEAATLAKQIGAKLVIPCHYDMFTFNTADPREQFLPECERIGQPCRVLRPGERWLASTGDE